MVRTSQLRRRLAAGWRWLLQPWRSPGLVTALIASFALPAFMAASADVFRLAAADSTTRLAVGDQPSGMDATVLATGRLDADGVEALDAAMRSRLGLVARLGEPTLTQYVPSSLVGLQRPPAEDGAPGEAIIGSGSRFLARDGAIEALQVVDGNRAVDGLWISERRSDRLGLGAGDLVVVDNGDPVPVAGVYADLWDGDRDPYWDDAPPAVVPTYSSVFGGPIFEVVIVSESLLHSFGLDGIARWDTALVERVETHADLIEHTVQLRRLERSYTEDEDMAAALAGFGGAGGPVPTTVTDAFGIRTDVDRIVADLDQPIRTTAFAGILLGLVVTAAGAAFAVRRREAEMRLLRADGDAWWRFAARAALQYLAPAAVGCLLGVLAGAALIALSAEVDRRRWDVIELGPIVRTVAVGVIIAAAVTAIASSRLLSTRRSAVAGLRTSWILPIVGVAVAAWIEVGSAAVPGDVDPLVVAFPLIGLVAGVGLIVVAARWVMRRVRRTGGSLPPPLFFAWRRITSAESGAVLLSAAMGIALGLVVFSTTLVDSLERARNAKAVTVVGGHTQARLVSPHDGELPDSTTLVRTQTTRLTIGGDPVVVLAVDPDDYADGVSWHPDFGGSADVVVDLLRTPVAADVAAVAIGGRKVPSDAGFGTRSVTSYEVVGHVDAAPLASDTYPTIVVSWDQMLDVARRQHESQRPADEAPEVWAEALRPPLLGARNVVVSQLDQGRLAASLVANGVEVREFTTLADWNRRPTTRAAQWAFGYLGFLAGVAALAAIGTLLFYLSEQRAARSLSSMLASRMGMRRAQDALADVFELLGLTMIAFVAGTATAVLLARRVFDRFEPDPRLPPDVGLAISWTLLATIAGAGIVAVVVAALVNHRIAAHRSYAEVLRGT